MPLSPFPVEPPRASSPEVGNTGASGGMSPRRPQTRVRSGAFLRVWRLKSNLIDSHRHEHDKSLKDMTDSRFFSRGHHNCPAISSASFSSDSGALPSALLLAVIQTRRLALKAAAAMRARTWRLSES